MTDTPATPATPAVPARSFQVTVDAADPQRLMAFWCTVLGYVEQPPPAGFPTWEAWADAHDVPVEDRDRYSAAVDPNGAGPRLLFQKVPEPKSAKNRMHLDVSASGGPGTAAEQRRAAVDAEAERLVAAGATVLAAGRFELGTYWTVLADPEGNEFCVH